MKIGTIKEIKNKENRVGLTPLWTKKLVAAGHEVYVQTGAGVGSGFSDTQYKESGAVLVDEPLEVVQSIDVLVKVKEPLKEEYSLLDSFQGKTLYTFLHLAAVDKGLTECLMRNNITSIAYETVEDAQGKLPLLTPMSEVAGIAASQYIAENLQKKNGGRGITMGKVSGSDSAHVVVVGGGVVGYNAARSAAGQGAHVTLFDINDARIAELQKEFASVFRGELAENIHVMNSNAKDEAGRGFAEYVRDADGLVGAVLVPGAAAPKVVSDDLVKQMKPGAVIVDVAIDQGGCIEGAKPTSHDAPIYMRHDKVFCCVANIPGQYANQSTQALTSATMPHLLKMADAGVEQYLKQEPLFAKGVNVYKGKITYKPVAEALALNEHFAELSFD